MFAKSRLLALALSVIPGPAIIFQPVQTGSPRVMVFRANDATRSAGEAPSYFWESLIDELAKVGTYDVLRGVDIPYSAISPMSDVSPGDEAGKRQGAAFVVTSRITRIATDSTPGTQVARVEARASLFDVAAREIVFSASVSGEASGADGSESTAPTTYLACRKAAVVAAKRLAEYRPTQALVAGITDGYPGLIKLDRGSNHGLTPRRMVVLLDGNRRIGKAVITSATEGAAEARVFEIEGDVKPGIRARAIRDAARPGALIGPYGEYWAPVRGKNLLLAGYFSLPTSARVGSNRRALLTNFRTMGGLHSAYVQTYVLKDPLSGEYARDADGSYRIITVSFRLARARGDGLPEESPEDVIVKVMGPFSTRGLAFD